jgi:hypothetical protein
MGRASACLLVCAVACSGAAKRETSTLITAVDRYRRADATSKAAEALAVSHVECTNARVCGAKVACVAAIDPTTRALALKDEVARRLVDLQEKRIAPTSPEAQTLPDKLDEATRLLREGRTKMSECDRQLTDLVVEFGG